jgi:hypothetical protein
LRDQRGDNERRNRIGNRGGFPLVAAHPAVVRDRDLVSDDLARTVIIEDLAEADPLKLRQIATAALDATIEFGPTGKLDECFLDEKQRKRLETASLLPTRAAIVVAERATSVLRPDNARRDHDTLDVLAASNVIAAELLDRIAKHVKAWPFERPRGRFGADQTTR